MTKGEVSDSRFFPTGVAFASTHTAETLQNSRASTASNRDVEDGHAFQLRNSLSLQQVIAEADMEDSKEVDLDDAEADGYLPEQSEDFTFPDETPSPAMPEDDIGLSIGCLQRVIEEVDGEDARESQEETTTASNPEECVCVCFQKICIDST